MAPTRTTEYSECTSPKAHLVLYINEMHIGTTYSFICVGNFSINKIIEPNMGINRYS